LQLAERLRVDIDLWSFQNLFWELLNEPAERSETDRALVNELSSKLKFSKGGISQHMIGDQLGHPQ